MQTGTPSLFGRFATALVLAALAGCGGDAGPAPSTAPESQTPASAAPDAPETAFSWPADAATGRLRQVAKYAEDLESGTNLYKMSDFPGGVMPDRPVDPLGIALTDAHDIEELHASGRFVFVDVRKDPDVDSMGTIPGAVHLEYRHEGFPYDGRTRLTAASLAAELEGKDGVVLFCNGEKCPRSYNACLQAVEEWGVDAAKLRWLRDGVPAWTKSLLVAPSPAASGTDR